MEVSASSIILFLFWFGCKGVACNEYPEDCVPPNSNDPSVNKTYNAIYDSILYISSNETIFSGHNVTFEIVVNKSGIDTSLSLKIIAFVDGDEEIGQCSSNKTTEQTSMVCTLKNVSFTRSVRFLIVTSPPVLHFCQPPSVVFIKEETVTILDVTINRCEGISFTFGIVSDGARIVCNVYNTSDGRSPLYSNSSCDNLTVVPPEVFKNHTGEYKLIVYSVKNGAKGNKSNMTFSLSNEGLKFSIVEVSVDLMEGNFVATLIVKINESCLLSIPNYFFITSNCSNCSNNKQQELNLNKFLGHHSLYYNQLESQKKNCVLFIEDSGGNKINYIANLNSFHTRAFGLQTVSHNTVAVCHFLPHSPVDGCQLNITNDTMDVPIVQYITRDGDSLLATDVIVELDPGRYDIRVSDLIIGSNDYSETAFQTYLIIPHVTVIPSVTCSSSSIAPSTSTCLDPKESSFQPVQHNNYHYVLGFLIFFVIYSLVLSVSVLVVVAVLVLCYRRNKNRRQEHVIQSIVGETSPQGPSILDTPLTEISPLVEESSESVVDTNNGSAHHREDQNGINFSATEVAKESSQLSNADELIVITSQTSRNDTEAGSHCPFQCSNSGKAKDLSNNPPAPFEEESEGDESKNIVFHHSQTVRPESVAQGTVQFNDTVKEYDDEGCTEFKNDEDEYVAPDTDPSSGAVKSSSAIASFASDTSQTKLLPPQ